MKKDAYYFTHDSNAKDDPKCVLLIEQLGLEGYGIYWVLVETLRDQPDFKYPLSLIPAIARRYNSTTEKVKTVVLNYGLFKIENDEFFFSTSLVSRMIELQEKRLKRSLAGKKGNEIRWNEQKLITMQSQCDNNAITMQSQCIASKVKESKVKKSIGNKNKEEEKEEKEEKEDNKIFRKFAHLSITIGECKKLKQRGYTTQEIISVFDKIENFNKNTRYKSLYLTSIDWLKREYPDRYNKNESKKDKSKPLWEVLNEAKKPEYRV